MILLKEFIKSIKNNIGRFLALIGIVAIGAGFFAGLNMAGTDMRLSANAFYEQTNLTDLNVVSSLGLSNENIDKIKNIEGVKEVMPDKTTDAIALYQKENFVMRVHGIKDMNINKPIIESGHMPKESNECALLSNAVLNTEINIGDEIEISKSNADINKTFSNTKLKVVGFVTSPAYISTTSLGYTNLGAGRIQQVCFVDESCFKDDLPYTELYIKADGNVDEIKNNISNICPDLENDRTKEIKDEAMKKIDDSKAEIDKTNADTIKELNDAEAKLNEINIELQEGRKSLEEGKSELEQKNSELEATEKTTMAELYKKYSLLEDSLKTLNKLSSQASASKNTWSQINVNNVLEFANTIKAIEQSLKALPEDESIEQCIALTNAIYEASIEADTNIKKASTEAEKLAILTGYINNVSPSVDLMFAACGAITDTIPDLQESLNKLNLLINETQNKFNNARHELDIAIQKIIEGESALVAGFFEYQKGVDEFNTSKHDAEILIAEAYQKLFEAKEDIDNMSGAEFYVLDRSKIASVESFAKDANRMDSIAAVFPLFFFIVAALVALTTMTRMIDEDRILIGTLKALGLSRFTITLKYIFYGVAVSLIGSIIGIAVLSQILPWIVMIAYSIIYTNPIMLTPINIPIAIISAGICIALIVFVSLLTCNATLREKPASLMLPLAPKPGKRILLERITIFWNRLSFNWKVTLRNLFRYKKRLFMTVIGIAGCFALLLVGFGLRDSINDIIDKNYTDICHDNCTILYSDNIDSEQKAQLTAELKNKNNIDSYVPVNQTNYMTDNGLNTSLILASHEALHNLRTLRNRTDGTNYHFEFNSYSKKLEDNYMDGNTLHIKHGAIICEKIARKCNLKVGDKLKIYEIDKIGNATDKYYEIDIAGICENYVGNLVYMKLDDFNVTKKFNGVFSKYVGTDKADFVNKLDKISSVQTVSFNDEVIENYRIMLNSVNMVVVVLIISAAFLAFIVLYNLTNINITERIRELATLKVLGFKSRETNMYINRETLILTVIGIIFGLFFGNFLEEFVISSAEVDAVMFGREIHLFSYVISAAITLAFTIVVIVFMKRKIKKINMVESLKSID